jgi:hypothetical protein
MNTITNVAGFRGTRLHVEPVAPAFVLPAYVRTWRQRPSVLVLSGFGMGASITDNSTGVSEVEYRHR